jgi:hypothetical protein
LGSEEESQERALRSGDKTQSDVIDGSKNKGRGGVKDLKAKGQRGLVMALYLCTYSESYMTIEIHQHSKWSESNEYNAAAAVAMKRNIERKSHNLPLSESSAEHGALTTGG